MSQANVSTQRPGAASVAYRYPRVLVLGLALILVSGLSALQVLPRQEDPSLTDRNATVLTLLPGADAERTEVLVTEKIEEKLREIEEIRVLQSTTRAGVSVISVELADTVRNVEAVWSRLRGKLDEARPDLPDAASEPELEEQKIPAFTFITGFVWELDTPVEYGVLRRLAEDFEDRLRTLPGTADTELSGAPQEEVLIELDADKLAVLQLSAEQVAQACAAADAKVSAGALRTETSNLLMEVEGEFDTLERIRRIPIRVDAAGRFVRLGNIAEVRKAIADPPDELAQVSGAPAILIAARMEPELRVDLWARDARAAAAEFSSNLPTGVRLQTVFDQSRYVADRLGGLTWNLGLGAALVAVVLWIMMGWRAAVLVSTALPLSVLMVLAGLNFLDIPLHQMSVTGLIIALGLLIDNAIVMVHEVQSRLARGATPLEAIESSVRLLAGPLFGSTLTTVLAFMPIVLMPGGAGEFVGSIGLSVILAVCSSFVLALTVVPALTGLEASLRRRRTSQDAKTYSVAGARTPWLASVFRVGCAWLYAHPVMAVLLSLLLPAYGFYRATGLEMQFFPPAERDQAVLEIELARETPLAETNRLAQDIRARVLTHAGVADVHWTIGKSTPKFYYNILSGIRDNSPYYAQAMIQLTSSTGSTELIRSLQRDLDAAFPQAQTLVRQIEQGPPFDAPVEVRLYGPDLATLRRLGDEVRSVLAGLPEVIHTCATLTDDERKLWLRLDDEETRVARLDNSAVARQLASRLDGLAGGSLLEATEELPVRVRVLGPDRTDLNRVASLDLVPPDAGPDGSLNVGTVPLSVLGHFELRPDLAAIPRRDALRCNTVQGFITAGTLPAKIASELANRLAAGAVEFPVGYRYEFGGEEAERARAIGNLMASVNVLVVLMVASLVMSFRSFRAAGILVLVAIMSIGLGLAALALFGFPFGFMAIVGTMGLVGVAINDSIVVLAALYASPSARRAEWRGVEEVLMHEVRHVLSTTLTTVAGFIPLWLGGGGFWPPLAVTIAGGVVGATVLALVFVPAMFLLLVAPCRQTTPVVTPQFEPATV